jgi:hypothetical protein
MFVVYSIHGFRFIGGTPGRAASGPVNAGDEGCTGSM